MYIPLRKFILVFYISSLGIAGTDAHNNRSVLLGVDNLLQNKVEMIKGKRVGLLTNPSGVNGDLEPTSDLLHAHPDINLTALFGPEHGIRGAVHAGLKVGDATDERTGLPVYSLYGERRKPDPESLKQVDVILVDIQDVGVRGYTYIYTMAKVMEAAAESGKKVIVLDRPNPLGGLQVEGNITEPAYYSFVGLYPIPYRHGMTIGELAKLFNEEFDIGCDLEIIKMLSWRRDMLWGDTGLQWVPTSPHVPHWMTTLYMCATGPLGELHVLSNGVGYTSPFELIGAPWVDGEELARELNALGLPGIHFRPIRFKHYYLFYEGEPCGGVQLHITDTRKFRAFITGIYIMDIHAKLYPGQDQFENLARLRMFNKVMGTDTIHKMIKKRTPVHKIEDSWREQLKSFKEIRKNYLLY